MLIFPKFWAILGVLYRMFQESPLRYGLEFDTCIDQFREKEHVGNIECSHELDSPWHSPILLNEGTFLSIPTLNKNNKSNIAILHKTLAVDVSEMNKKFYFVEGF